MDFKYKHAGLGGTFDRIHAGHHQLIGKALDIAKKITIGLTIDGFSNKKKFNHLILPYEKRKQDLEDFIESIDQLNRVIIVPLSDIYGPTTDEGKGVDCLVVTRHTFSGAKKINQKRNELNLSKLSIIQADLITDVDGKYLSSTRIRTGNINRKGEIYSHSLQQDYIFSQDKKNKLKDPQGKLFSPPIVSEIREKTKDIPCISLVGDIVSAYFIENNLPFGLAVYDGRTQQKETNIFSKLIDHKPHLKIENKAGTIQKDVYQSIQNLLFDKEQRYIFVDGEEDLIAVALVLMHPLGSLIFYGQPRQGIVMIEVTEENKEFYKQLIS